MYNTLLYIIMHQNTPTCAYTTCISLNPSYHGLHLIKSVLDSYLINSRRLSKLVYPSVLYYYCYCKRSAICNENANKFQERKVNFVEVSDSENTTSHLLTNISDTISHFLAGLFRVKSFGSFLEGYMRL